MIKTILYGPYSPWLRSYGGLLIDVKDLIRTACRKSQ